MKDCALPDYLIKTYETWEVCCTYRIPASSPELALQTLQDFQRDGTVDQRSFEVIEQTIHGSALIGILEAAHE